MTREYAAALAHAGFLWLRVSETAGRTIRGHHCTPGAFAGGQPGSEIETPMAVVIVCGLVTSTALNMLVVPALHLRLGSVGRTLHAATELPLRVTLP
jgi:hypothetical protein